MVLVGVEHGDEPADAAWLAAKTAALRIFADEAGVMNRSVTDVGGEVLAVSQFTLTASTARAIARAISVRRVTTWPRRCMRRIAPK